MTLEAFQSGLSWITVLRKRENFRRAYAGFDPGRVAAFTEDDVTRLLSDPGIIRNWVASCRDDLVPGVPLGGWGDAHVVDPPKSRGPRQGRYGDSLFTCRFGVPAARGANPPDASTRDIVAGLLLRVAFLLLGVAALLGGVALVCRPELPGRLIAWLTKHEDPLLTADSEVRD
jgi:hypothetical protein